jgi:protease PrsW
MDIWLGLVAIVPGLLIAYWVYRQDRYEPEPPVLLLYCFLLGALSVVPPLFIQAALRADSYDQHSWWAVTIDAFLVVGLSEEGSKFLFLYIFPYQNDEFDEPMDGIVYAVMISMGFATTENLMYIFQLEPQLGIATGLRRALTAIPAHAAFAILMGANVGLAKFRPKRRAWYLFRGLALAVLFHGLYDFFLFQENYEWMGVLSLIVLYVALRYSQQLIAIGQEISPFRPDYMAEMDDAVEDLDKN